MWIQSLLYMKGMCQPCSSVTTEFQEVNGYVTVEFSVPK